MKEENIDIKTLVDIYKEVLKSFNINLKVIEENNEIFFLNDKKINANYWIQNFKEKIKFVSLLKQKLNNRINSNFISYFNKHKHKILEASVFNIGKDNINLSLFDTNALLPKNNILQNDNVYKDKKIYVYIDKIDIDINNKPYLICKRNGTFFVKYFLNDYGLDIHSDKIFRIDSLLSVVFLKDNIIEKYEQIIKRYKSLTGGEKLLFVKENITTEDLVKEILEKDEGIIEIIVKDDCCDIVCDVKRIGKLIGKYGMNSKILNKILKSKINFIPK